MVNIYQLIWDSWSLYKVRVGKQGALDKASYRETKFKNRKALCCCNIWVGKYSSKDGGSRTK